ncbi:hypothetical protein CTRI78_v010369 [Colletotrichum trifolii]|uniref:Heterokaryon incompatibility domain-containing protein n=1 Tax=Colletotrichum trifolii TaxID=5466 RepID=A0A4V3HTJ3_COLTR|nr:hypothetical protein CTRI78_v010369 [Colletotrichum trifolii]
MKQDTLRDASGSGDAPVHYAAGIRLLNVPLERFETFNEADVPSYAAISYAWHAEWSEEVVFSDVQQETGQRKPGFSRFIAACNLALALGLQYLWCDTVCTDTTSNEESSQVMRDLQRCLQLARVFLVYFPEVSAGSSLLSFQARSFGTTNTQLPSQNPPVPDVRSSQRLITTGRIELFHSQYKSATTATENPQMPTSTARWHDQLQNRQGRATLRNPPCLSGWSVKELSQDHIEALKRALEEFSKPRNPTSTWCSDGCIKSPLSFDTSDPASGGIASQFNADTTGDAYKSEQCWVHVNPSESSTDDSSTVTMDIRSSSGSWVYVNDAIDSGREKHSLLTECHGVHSSLQDSETPFPASNVKASLSSMGHIEWSPSKESSKRILSWMNTAVGSQQSQRDAGTSSRVDVNGADLGLNASDDRCSVASPQSSSGRVDKWRHYDEWTSLDSSLDSEHPLLMLRDPIIEKALRRFSSWRVQSLRRTSFTEDHSRDDDLSASRGPSARKRMRKEYACPYYKSNPAKYAACLKLSRLGTIRDVRDHVWQQHRLPFYCPVCKKDFRTASGRDRHIVSRNCMLSDDFPFEGVSEDQRRLLLRRRKNLKPGDQWLQIWKLLFANRPPPKSSLLKDAVGQEVVAFRHFWRRKGEAIIYNYLSGRNLTSWDRRCEERDLASLYTAVFRGAVDMLAEKISLTPCT